MGISELLAWIASGVLALLGIWIIILNYSVVISWYLHRRSHSRIPLLGGLSLMAGMLASPLPTVARYAWVPLVIDLGCLHLLVTFLYVVVWRQVLKR